MDAWIELPGWPEATVAGVAAVAHANRLFLTLGRILLIVVLAVVAVIVALWFKRRILGDSDPTEHPPAGFGLSDLRRLRDEGKLTPAEYEAARGQIVARSKKAVDAPAEEDPSRPTPKNLDLIRKAEER